jgi:hypothetical protein
MLPTISKPPRRFPPPWTVEETAPCFIVRDANGQALAHVYFRKRDWPAAETQYIAEGTFLSFLTLAEDGIASLTPRPPISALEY